MTIFPSGSAGNYKHINNNINRILICRKLHSLQNKYVFLKN